MQSIASIEIDRPIEDVFWLANTRIADWSLIVVEDELIDETPDGIGSTFRTVTEDRGQRMEFAGVVTAFDPPYYNAAHMVGKLFDIDSEFQFEDLGSRTRVTQVSTVIGKGFIFKLMLTIMGWVMPKASSRSSELELKSLKQFCERYDGPIS